MKKNLKQRAKERKEQLSTLSKIDEAKAGDLVEVAFWKINL